jgi:hypothetical protein
MRSWPVALATVLLPLASAVPASAEALCYLVTVPDQPAVGSCVPYDHAVICRTVTPSAPLAGFVVTICLPVGGGPQLQ